MQHDCLKWRHNMQYLNESNWHKYPCMSSTCNWGQKKKTNPRHLEDCSIDVETKHGTYMSYTSINIGHRAHRLFPFLECKCGAHFILMFTADKWIKMKTVPLYRKMHPISNECKRKNHVQVLGSHNKGSVKGVTCK